MTAIQLIRERLAVGAATGIRLGAPKTAGALTLVPIFAAAPAANSSALPYISYATALERGSIEIHEVGEAGTVPNLLVSNRGDAPVLLIEGEIIVGLNQNRVLNVSVLIPASSDVTIPVTCVEAGRWRRASARGARDLFHLSPKIRAMKNRTVAESARHRTGYRADQHAVWDGVAERLAVHGVESGTAAYSAISAAHQQELMDAAKTIQPEPEQRGVIALAGGEPMCLDLFDRSDTLAATWESLVGSYMADAMVLPEGKPLIDIKQVEEWLQQAVEAETTEHDAVGAGATVIATGARATTTALVHDQTVLHLSIVGTEGEDS